MASTATPRIRESAPAGQAAWLEKIESLSSALEHAPELVEHNPALDPGEINALYREVFEAQQVQRRLSGPRRVERGPFEIANCTLREAEVIALWRTRDRDNQGLAGRLPIFQTYRA